MTTELQLKISSDPRLVSFIRQYPIWYKRLNRNPLLFKDFTEDMKDKFKIRPSDRLNKTLENISMIQTFLNVLILILPPHAPF